MTAIFLLYLLYSSVILGDLFNTKSKISVSATFDTLVTNIMCTHMYASLLSEFPAGDDLSPLSYIIIGLAVKRLRL